MLSACCFIRDNQKGAFCLWESVASWLPLVDEFIILDLGSSDGTLELLRHVEANPKIRVVQGTFPVIDAGAFATLANDLIGMCRNDHVLFYQSDEVPHEHLLQMAREWFAKKLDWSFWRVQLGWNFQEPRWYPHLVHRVGPKDNFHFVGDGMNSNRVFGVDVCSNYNAGWFSKWGELGVPMLKEAIHEMLLDVSLLGGFRDVIPERKRMHAPFWHETPTVENLPVDEWHRRAVNDERWTRTESPFNIPAILRWHIGKTTYQVRDDLIASIIEDRTWEYIEALK